MKTYKIAGINISIDSTIESNLNSNLNMYETNESAQYFIKTIITSYISVPSEAKSINTLQKMYYEFPYYHLYHYNKDNIPTIMIKHTVDFKNIEIELSTILADKLKMREYIISGMCFFEIALREGFIPLHASAIGYNNQAILFSAPSGIGKSTQAKLWKSLFPCVEYINDDKPLLACGKDIVVYGTPWSGKDYVQNNVQYKLKAILFLEQSKEDKITLLTEKEKIISLLRNTHRSFDTSNQELMMKGIERLIEKAQMLKYECTPTINSVKIAHEYLFGDLYDK